MLESIPFLIALFTFNESFKPKLYSLDHFYFYDETKKLNYLPLTTKAIVDCSEEKKKTLIRNIIRNIVGFESLPEGLLLLTFKTPTECLNFLNSTWEKTYPVVNWNGLEVYIPYHILIKSKVDQTALTERIAKTTNINLKSIKDLGDKKFLVEVESFANPRNMFIFANLFALDSYWCEWARVDFVPLREAIVVITELETSASTNLGEERVLHVLLRVYDSKIEIRKDLLPMMGNNNFVPLPFNGDMMFEAKGMKVKEWQERDCKVVLVSYNFKYFGVGGFKIVVPSIPYEKAGKLDYYHGIIYPVNLNVSSVLANSDIDDLQPIKSDVKIKLKENELEQEVNYWYWLLYFTVGLVGLNVLFLVLCFLLRIINWVSSFVTKKDDLEEQVLELLGKIDEGNWKGLYLEINKLVSRLGVPKSITLELEKVYQRDVVPDLTGLKFNLTRAFKNAS